MKPATAIRTVLESVTHAPCRTAGALRCLLGPIQRCTDGLAGLRELAMLERTGPVTATEIREGHRALGLTPPPAAPPAAPMGTCCRAYHGGKPHPELFTCELWEPDEPHHTPTPEDT